VIDSEKGETSPTGEPVEGELENILRLEKGLAYQILAWFGVEPTPEERKKIDRLPTEDFLAFLAYSRGLQLEEEGNLDGAIEAYEEAIERDSDFEEPRDAKEIIEFTIPDMGAAEDQELQWSFPPDDFGLGEEIIEGIAVTVGTAPLPDDGLEVGSWSGREEAGAAWDPRPPDSDKWEPGRVPEFPPPPGKGGRK
jgi:hypothetical protein